MTDYLVVFMPQAANDLRRLDKAVAQRIVHKLKWLSQNFSHLTPETLTGEFKGFHRLRVGSYRVIYVANQKSIRSWCISSVTAEIFTGAKARFS